MSDFEVKPSVSLEEANSLDAVAEFKIWLLENGVKFGNVDWPCYNTASGDRGAVAVEEINPYDTVLQVPMELLLTPVKALADPVIGDTLLRYRNLLRGDLLLAVYVMHERRKGAASFFYPFLRIFPDPPTVAIWSDVELSWFQVRIFSSLTNHENIFFSPSTAPFTSGC
jgi:hypothetical protein